jgi:hypothetical protein
MHITIKAERTWLMVLIQIERTRIASLQAEGIGGA